MTERPKRTVQGYRRFRCRACGKQFNERTGGLLNRAQYPSDVIAIRYDKTALAFLGFLHLDAAKLWLSSFINRT